MISKFFDKTAVNVRRSTPTPTSTDAIATIGSFSGMLWPITDKSELFVETNMGKEYAFLCDDAENVLVGDTVVIDGAKYETISVTTFRDLIDGSDSYTEVRLVK